MKDSGKNIKVNERDVFEFTYSDKYKESHKNLDLNHCFDGQLIARKQSDGSFILVDTYWTCGSYSRRFTISEALEQGDLKFKCNLDDVENCSKYELKYYREEDIIDLSTQHHCYESYAKKKGAQRSKVVMLAYIDYEIGKKEHDISWAQRQIELLKEKANQINNGEDINKIYL